MEKFGVELWLNRADREPTGVCRLIDVVVRSPTVEDIGTPLALVVAAHRNQLVEHGGEERASFNHGPIDDLTQPRSLPLEEGTDISKGGGHGSASEVAEQVQRWNGSLTGVPDQSECA